MGSVHGSDKGAFHKYKDAGKPFQFVLGRNMVIPCWEEVMAELSVGDKIKFTCPHHLGYGEKEMKDIPAKSNLVFEVEMMEFTD